MSEKKTSDREYLYLSAMLKAREANMLTRDKLERILAAAGRDVEHAGGAGVEDVLRAVGLVVVDLHGGGRGSVVLDVVTIRLRLGAGRIGELAVHDKGGLERARRHRRVGLGAFDQRRLAGSEQQAGNGKYCNVE